MPHSNFQSVIAVSASNLIDKDMLVLLLHHALGT